MSLLASLFGKSESVPKPRKSMLQSYVARITFKSGGYEEWTSEDEAFVKKLVDDLHATMSESCASHGNGFIRSEIIQSAYWYKRADAVPS